MNEDLMNLVDSVLHWWDLHQYDTCGGEGEEWNVYLETPEFVVMAQNIRQRITNGDSK